MTRLLALLLMLAPGLALAADGDVVTGSNRQNPIGVVVLLCDSKTANDTSCPNDPGYELKQPMRWSIFSINEDDGCTSATVTINQRATTNGDDHSLCTLTVGGTTSCIIDGPYGRYVSAAITGLADCTDLDITGEFIK